MYGCSCSLSVNLYLFGCCFFGVRFQFIIGLFLDNEGNSRLSEAIHFLCQYVHNYFNHQKTTGSLIIWSCVKTVPVSIWLYLQFVHRPIQRHLKYSSLDHVSLSTQNIISHAETPIAC